MVRLGIAWLAWFARWLGMRRAWVMRMTTPSPPSVCWRGPCSMSCLGRFWEMRLCWRRRLSGMSMDFPLTVLPLRGSVWLTLGVLPVVVPSALAGAVVWLAPVTECLAVWLGRCRVRCALCLLPPRILASSREACVKPKR